MAGLECHIRRMTDKHPKRPRDPNQLAKSIVDLATGEASEHVPAAPKTKRNIGGLKGGNARAKSLSPLERQQIAQKAATARWEKKQS